MNVKNKLIRYYPREFINYYADIPVGGLAAIVSKLKNQPPEGYQGEYDSSWRPELSFPFATIVGMPETWGYDINGNMVRRLQGGRVSPMHGKDNWHSPVTMPSSAIRLLWKVKETRICRVQEVTLLEAESAGIKFNYTDYHDGEGTKLDEFKNWYSTRYGAWDSEDWVEIAEITRTGKP